MKSRGYRILLVLMHYGIYTANLDKPIFKIESPFKNPVTFVYDKENLFNAVDTLNDFFNKVHLSKFVKFHVGIFEKYGVTIKDVHKTIEFVKQTLQTDPAKMSDPGFLEKHFTFYRWYVKTDHTHVLHGHYGPPDYIRTTSYLIAHINGSSFKTDTYCVPLHGVPLEEKHMTPAEIKNNEGHLLRFVFTRSEIIKGVFIDNPHVPLLGWVTLEDYKELVLQGSAIINFNNGSKKLCRVAKHNNKKGSDQYYFFSIEDKSIDPKKTKFPIKPDPIDGITLAGNIDGLGLGKLFLMINYTHCHGKDVFKARFGLLTDTGQAFKDNFHQVDMFAGYFAHRKDFKEHIVDLPHTAKMYLMIKK